MKILELRITILNLFKNLLLTILVLVIIFFIFSPMYIYLKTDSRIKDSIEGIHPHKVGIVFGAGVLPNRRPTDILRDRLDGAIELYEVGKIQKIIVSGDNRYHRYNEPQVMYEYLTSKGIPMDDVIRDYAGLRTYDTCIRAKTLWNVNRAVLITQKYHLYRAIYTCEDVGIESVGYSTTKSRYIKEAIFYSREVAALYKSIIDLHVIQPQYIGGSFEEDLKD
jgi:vancomycin permeability regulator SanA